MCHNPKGSRRGRLRVALLSVAILAILGLTQIDFQPAMPPAQVGSLDLAPNGASWMSDPIRLDATAVGLTWQQGAATSEFWIRAAETESDWGPWTEMHEIDDHDSDSVTEPSSSSTARSEAIYVGSARWVQVSATGMPQDLALAFVDTTGRSLSVWDRLGLLVEGVTFARSDSAIASPDQPPVQPRAAWGGDQCTAEVPENHTHYVDRVAVIFVHHTFSSATANAYSQAEVPELMYAICSFHVGLRGWDDIGYNAVIDRFGTIWEGRAGGLENGVLGAHTGGFNSSSTGMAFLGSFLNTAPSAEAQSAFLAYASWILDMHHINPMSFATVESLGSTKFEEGAMVPLRALSGHRDVSITSCPGDYAFAPLDSWAETIAAMGGPKIYGGWPDQDPVPGFAPSGYEPATFGFEMTEEMNWTLTISDAVDFELLRQSGSGVTASITWDPNGYASPLLYGDYTVRVDALPISGNPAPRPAEFQFTLGSFRPSFSDDDESPHEPDITTIYEAEITSGCGANIYCPLDGVPRWQMALFMTRFHAAAGMSLPEPLDQGYIDVSELTPDQLAAINQVTQIGVSQGTGAGSFDPAGWVTRWQMALFITRELQALGVTLPDGSTQPFNDIGEYPDTTQLAINQLAQLGVTLGTGEGTFGPDGVISREQMASFMARALAIIVPTSSSTP